MSKLYIVEMYDTKQAMWESLPAYHDLIKAKEAAGNISARDKCNTRVVSLITSFNIDYKINITEHGE